MAKIEMKGLEAYLQKLDRLDRRVRDELFGAAIYQGAAAVMDAVKEEIRNIPEDDGFGTPAHPVRGIPKRALDGLLSSAGISKMRSNEGFLNVKIGFSGYNSITTKRWPNGQPNAMIARSVERGTSFMTPVRFMTKAVRASKKKAIAVMQETVDAQIQKIMKE